MNIASTVLGTIADLLLLSIIFNALNAANENIGKPSPKCVILSYAAVCVIGAASYSTFFSHEDAAQLLLALINPVKFLIIALAIYKRPIIKTACSVLIIQFFCELLSYSVQSVMPIELRKQSSFCSSLVLALVRLALLLLFVLINRSPQKTMYVSAAFKLIPVHIFILITASCFLTSGLIHTADFDTSDIELKTKVLKLLSLSVAFCVIAVLASLLTNALLKKYYSDINELLEKQVQIQLSHYEKREKINTEIRSFRHDYINHINCMKALIKSEKYAEASEYLNNISDVFPAGSFIFNTGNYISDAILSDKQESVKKDGISLSFDGTIPSFINNTDLCVILSNAIDNAAEACMAVENEKIIEISGGFRHGYFILTVKNPTVNKLDDKEIPQTTKPDNLYHGFGLRNIKAVVEKYNGAMKIENNDGCFILSLTFNSGLTE